MPILVVFLAISIAVGLVRLGYLLARDRLRADRQQVELQKQLIAVEWFALYQVGRIRALELWAEQAMQQEALHGGPPPTNVIQEVHGESRIRIPANE